VVAVAHMEKLDAKLIARELGNFSGVKRRFAEKDLKDMIIVDDYAHHPNEIKATLDAARQKYPDKAIIAVFQPHTFSRTQAYEPQYVQVLSQADQTFLTPIFSSAREKTGKIRSEDITAQIKGAAVIHQEDMKPLLQYHNAVVVFMGAGDIQKYEKAYETILAEE
ncbi:MAG: glutamate ligase domain-containing protein, partial [Lacticaseibacillus paracasei]